MKKYRIEFLPAAWREIDEISDYYLNKAGPKSAKKIFDKILKAIDRLEIFPLSCPIINDEVLSQEGYSTLICDDYICIYRLINDVVYIYHIANGRINYKNFMIWIDWGALKKGAFLVQINKMSNRKIKEVRVARQVQTHSAEQ